MDAVQLVRTNGCAWTALNEPGVSGISVKPLRFDERSQRSPTFLLKFEAGATYPAHDHPAGEEVFVFEGDVTFGKHHLTAGDYLYTPPNGKHAVWSQTGCIMLLSVPEEVVILKAAVTGSSGPEQQLDTNTGPRRPRMGKF
jgi:quercetin dioxygenase-like cupin family protein